MGIHLLLAMKKASVDTSSAGIETLFAWIIHHMSTLDEAMKLILSTILVFSALVRLATGTIKFYYTLKNKGANGD